MSYEINNLNKINSYDDNNRIELINIYKRQNEINKQSKEIEKILNNFDNNNKLNNYKKQNDLFNSLLANNINKSVNISNKSNLLNSLTLYKEFQSIKDKQINLLKLKTNNQSDVIINLSNDVQRLSRKLITKQACNSFAHLNNKYLAIRKLYVYKQIRNNYYICICKATYFRLHNQFKRVANYANKQRLKSVYNSKLEQYNSLYKLKQWNKLKLKLYTNSRLRCKQYFNYFNTRRLLIHFMILLKYKQNKTNNEYKINYYINYYKIKRLKYFFIQLYKTIRYKEINRTLICKHQYEVYLKFINRLYKRFNFKIDQKLKIHFFNKSKKIQRKYFLKFCDKLRYSQKYNLTSGINRKLRKYLCKLIDYASIRSLTRFKYNKYQNLYTQILFDRWIRYTFLSNQSTYAITKLKRNYVIIYKANYFNKWIGYTIRSIRMNRSEHISQKHIKRKYKLKYLHIWINYTLLSIKKRSNRYITMKHINSGTFNRLITVFNRISNYNRNIQSSINHYTNKNLRIYINRWISYTFKSYRLLVNKKKLGLFQESKRRLFFIRYKNRYNQMNTSPHSSRILSRYINRWIRYISIIRKTKVSLKYSYKHYDNSISIKYLKYLNEFRINKNKYLKLSDDNHISSLKLRYIRLLRLNSRFSKGIINYYHSITIKYYQIKLLQRYLQMLYNNIYYKIQYKQYVSIIINRLKLHSYLIKLLYNRNRYNLNTTKKLSSNEFRLSICKRFYRKLKILRVNKMTDKLNRNKYIYLTNQLKLKINFYYFINLYNKLLISLSKSDIYYNSKVIYKYFIRLYYNKNKAISLSNKLQLTTNHLDKYKYNNCIMKFHQRIMNVHQRNKKISLFNHIKLSNKLNKFKSFVTNKQVNRSNINNLIIYHYLTRYMKKLYHNYIFNNKFNGKIIHINTKLFKNLLYKYIYKFINRKNRLRNYRINSIKYRNQILFSKFIKYINISLNRKRNFYQIKYSINIFKYYVNKWKKSYYNKKREHNFYCIVKQLNCYHMKSIYYHNWITSYKLNKFLNNKQNKIMHIVIKELILRLSIIRYKSKLDYKLKLNCIDRLITNYNKNVNKCKLYRQLDNKCVSNQMYKLFIKWHNYTTNIWIIRNQMRLVDKKYRKHICTKVLDILLKFSIKQSDKLIFQ